MKKHEIFGGKESKIRTGVGFKRTLNFIAKDFELDPKSEESHWNISIFISYLFFFLMDSMFVYPPHILT